MLRCPVCRKSVAPRLENPAFPFCSDRCKMIDLGKWLGEEYRIPGRPEESEDELPPVPGRDDEPA
ncbi:MAG: DNA gyrase inhibitor YacG [Myxococcales bacterium]